MSRPKEYDPQPGYKYQIFTRQASGGERRWEHCDYAADVEELRYIVREQSTAYGPDFRLHFVRLPKKYWPQKKPA